MDVTSFSLIANTLLNLNYWLQELYFSICYLARAKLLVVHQSKCSNFLSNPIVSVTNTTIKTVIYCSQKALLVLHLLPHRFLTLDLGTSLSTMAMQPPNSNKFCHFNLGPFGRSQIKLHRPLVYFILQCNENGNALISFQEVLYPLCI